MFSFVLIYSSSGSIAREQTCVMGHVRKSQYVRDDRTTFVSPFSTKNIMPASGYHESCSCWNNRNVDAAIRTFE